MALKTPEEYKESLRKLAPNIYKFGESIEDVTAHPATKRSIEGHAQIFAAGLNPEYEDLATTISPLTRERVSRYLAVPETAEDTIKVAKMKRLMFHLTGTCTGGRCVGGNGINGMWPTTYEMDQKLGTKYHQHLTKWLRNAQASDIALAGALNDAKGNRSKPASGQEDPNMYLHLVEKRGDGIVVRGAKAIICGVAAANEIFVLPGAVFREGENDYAISFVVPRDIDGLTIVEARHPSDTRESEEGFDAPVTIGGISQAWLLFQDVFVPYERVFMCGEIEFTAMALTNFLTSYLTTQGGCVAGLGDVMAGAAALMARTNGLSTRVFNDKLTNLYINNETVFSAAIAATTLGKKHPSGAWINDTLLANLTKTYSSTVPHANTYIVQDISGGIAELGCLPSSKDFYSPKHGHLVQKYLKAGSSAETRARAARMAEWLTIGVGVPGFIHGGGSPDIARRMVRAYTNLEEYIGYAKRLAGIDEDIPESTKG